MKNIKIYSTNVCPYCNAAKSLLKTQGLAFEEIKLDNKPELREKLSQENGNYRTVPMIFIDDKFIGGFTDLQKLKSEGKL